MELKQNKMKSRNAAVHEKQFIDSNEIVTVVIAIYNGSESIIATINSVLEQTFENIIILICDDASTDDSVQKVLAMNNQRINIIKNKTNIGLSKTREKLLDQVKTKWVAFIDQDDIWRYDKIEKQIDLMKSENCAMCHTFYNFIFKELNIKKTIKSKSKIRYNDLLNGNTPAASSVLINTEYFSELKGFCSNRYYDPVNDYVIWLHIFRGTNNYSICLEEPLMDYYFHGQNLSRNKLMQIFRHLFVLKNIEKVGPYILILSVFRNILNKIKGYVV
jgi:teichuronic acid biosynthesis glycosyltransferase TuaG|tara:strand:+ start:1418 stop:2242 length:825 start_codon:yes stop_codon:yes gene_type:complete